MKLIIPMAGRGKRLRPQSSVTPKPLLSVCGKSMVERIVEGFANTLPRPITDCVFVLGPSFARDAEPLLQDICHRQDVHPHFVVQHEPLGTGHAVAVAAEHLRGEGIVVYADTVFDMGQPANLDDCDVMVWVKHVADPSRFGVAVREGENVVAFVEKPQDLISTEALIGIYYVKELAMLYHSIQHLFERGIRGKGGEYYLTDAFDLMLREGGIFKTTSVRHWLDCGTLEAFMDTVRHLLRAEADALPANAGKNIIIIPPVFIGAGATLEDAVVGPYACIEKNAQVIRAVIRDSVLFEGATVRDVVLQDAFVGAHASVSPRPRSVNVGDYSVVK